MWSLTQPDILMAVGGAKIQNCSAVFRDCKLAMAFRNFRACRRITLNAMGRDGVINKKIFGHISPKSFTPSYNI